MIPEQEQEKLSEIANRVQAATPGPWFSSGELTADDGWTFATVGPFDTSDKPDRNHYEDEIADVSGINHNAEVNALLIANAPSDLHFLLDLVKRLAQ